MCVRVFVGAIATPVSKEHTHFLERGILCVREGVITVLENLDDADSTCLQEVPPCISNCVDSPAAAQVYNVLVSAGIEVDQCEYHFMTPNSFLCPGFVDTHTHACQVPNIGVGMEYTLLDWLNNVTFPLEQKFADTSFAEQVYKPVVQSYIRAGTTTACMYATLHLDATKALMDACRESGIRAFVGRCQMDRNVPSSYCEKDASTSCQDTRELIVYAAQYGPESIVQPILTPRFALCCTRDMLSGIATISREEPHLRIQTHLSENASEIAATMALFPEASSYTDVYDRFGLATDRTIFAHAIHLTEEEINTLVARKCGVSHCPTSNLGLRSGLFRLKHMLDKGVALGLGTDVSAGYTVSMQQAIRDAITVSKVISMQSDEESHISLNTLFYLATLGGAHVCGLQDRIGSLEVGKEFDALHVEGGAGGSLESRFWRWLVCGDDREIKSRFVRGVMLNP